MKKVILFIAASLDGYIADRRGGVGWLKGQDDDLEPSKSYDSFIKGVDTIIMGWNTYRQVTEELAPGNWPYAGLTSYVVTHRNRPSTEAVKFTSENPGLLVNAPETAIRKGHLGLRRFQRCSAAYAGTAH